MPPKNETRCGGEAPSVADRRLPAEARTTERALAGATGWAVKGRDYVSRLTIIRM